MSNSAITILVVEDDELMRQYVFDTLTGEGFLVEAFDCAADARMRATKGGFDLLVTDIRMGGESGLDLARDFCVSHPLVPVVVMTGYANQDYVRTSRELDTCAFLTKPFTRSQILFSVMTAMEERRGRLKRAGDHVTPADTTCGIAGSSTYIVEQRRRILHVARGEFPVVIQGPSGSGKELVAKAIHANSSRNAFPMVAINCAAIPEHLQESEFFGHRKGAFTGANADREGIFAAADNSTLFLDEVGDLALSTQAKLLRVLENKEYVPVGETTPRSVNVRVLSATNRDLKSMVNEGSFREDLYYRLLGDSITTQRLAEHAEDIPVLVEQFLAGLDNKRYPREITAEAMTSLVNRNWRGNVRELKHTVMLLAHAAAGMRRINHATIQSVMHEPVGPESDNDSYKHAKARVVEQFERSYFTRLLSKYQGNLTRAAEGAGMHRPNLIKKIKALGISPDSCRE